MEYDSEAVRRDNARLIICGLEDIKMGQTIDGEKALSAIRKKYCVSGKDQTEKKT